MSPSWGHIRQLPPYEKNYPTPDLELVGVVFALEVWHHYLYGVHVNIYTDHKILQYIFKQKDIKSRQQRWLELLKDNIDMLYHPRKTTVVVCALSHKIVASTFGQSVERQGITKDLCHLSSLEIHVHQSPEEEVIVQKCSRFLISNGSQREAPYWSYSITA